MWMTDERHVRRVIDEFNERGMFSVDPDYRGGRPRRTATVGTIEHRMREERVEAPSSSGIELARSSWPRSSDHLDG
jgi:hypothetical protein